MAHTHTLSHQSNHERINVVVFVLVDGSNNRIKCGLKCNVCDFRRRRSHCCSGCRPLARFPLGTKCTATCDMPTCDALVLPQRIQNDLGIVRSCGHRQPNASASATRSIVLYVATYGDVRMYGRTVNILLCDCVYLFSVIITKRLYNIIFFSCCCCCHGHLFCLSATQIRRAVVRESFHIYFYFIFRATLHRRRRCRWCRFSNFRLWSFRKHSSARSPIHIVIAHLCVRKYLLSAATHTHTPNVIAPHKSVRIKMQTMNWWREYGLRKRMRANGNGEKKNTFGRWLNSKRCLLWSRAEVLSASASFNCTLLFCVFIFIFSNFFMRLTRRCLLLATVCWAAKSFFDTR